MSTFTDPALSSVTPVVSVDLGAPLGVQAVLSWSVQRDLVGSSIAGTIRGGGLSIGSGSVTVPHAGVTTTPWAKGAARITPGGEAILQAEAVDGETMPLDTWLIAPQQGNLRSGQMSVELREKQYAGRKVDNLLPALLRADTEPAWIIDALARQIGYYSTPAPVASCLSALPMCGAVWEEANPGRADSTTTTNITGWGGVRGALGPIGEHHIVSYLGVVGYLYLQALYIPVSDPWLLRDEPLFWTVDVVGTEEAWFGYGATGQVHVRIDAETHTVGVRAGDGRPWVTVPYEPGLDANYPQRVQVQIERSGIPDPSDDPRESIGTLGPQRVRARSSHDAPWSAWAVDTWQGLTNGAYDLSFHGAAGSSFAGSQITTEADPLLWAPPTAQIDPLGGVISAPYLPATTDVWAGIQEVASKWLAAAWRDRDGVLQVRERGYLAGNGPVRESIDVGRRVEDLPWILDPADTADRVVVKWAPVDLVEPQNAVAPTLWEATEAVRLGPGEKVVLVADLDRLSMLHGANYSSQIAIAWMPMWSIYGEQLSTWSAYPNRDGTGTRPGDAALSVTTRRTSAARIEIHIRNRTSRVLWTVDDQGQPHLKLRGMFRFDQEQQITIERGASAEEAVNALEVDLGRHVQRAQDAEEIADHLYARLSSGRLYRIDKIRVVPDWSRDIGQIVELHHARSSLRVKALIVGDGKAGKPGEVTQHLDVVVLLPTYRDQSEAWAGQTYADLTARWVGRTYADLTDDPLSTGA